MSRELLRIIMAAMIAGAIGFGIAVYAVPIEEIVQFRALINAGLGAISTTNHPDNGNARLDRTNPPPSKASTQLDTPTRRRSDANSGCDPHNVNCIGGSPTVTDTPSDVPHRNGGTENGPRSEGGDKLQAPAPESEPARIPSSPPIAGSEKAHVAPEGHSRRPTKKELKNAPQSSPEH